MHRVSEKSCRFESVFLEIKKASQNINIAVHFYSLRAYRLAFRIRSPYVQKSHGLREEKEQPICVITRTKESKKEKRTQDTQWRPRTPQGLYPLSQTRAWRTSAARRGGNRTLRANGGRRRLRGLRLIEGMYYLIRGGCQCNVRRTRGGV